MKSPPPCRVCGGNLVARVLQAKERMFGLDGEFFYALCQLCGSLSQTDSDINLSRYYPPEYYSFSSVHPFGWKARLASGIGRLLPGKICSHAGRISYSIRSVADIRNSLSELLGRRLGHPRILDVGCGSGAGLLAYHYAGCRIEGIDPFYEGDDPAEFPIHRLEMADLSGRYDLITFNHSLEHTPDPRSHLEHAHRLLDDDGACVVRLPKLPSAAFDRYQECWFALDAPRHYFIPSIKGLSEVAKDVGFKRVIANDEASPKSLMWSEAYHRGAVRHGSQLTDVLSEEQSRELQELAESAFSEGRSCHGRFIMTKH